MKRSASTAAALSAAVMMISAYPTSATTMFTPGAAGKAVIVTNPVIQVHGWHRKCRLDVYGWHRHTRTGHRVACVPWRYLR
ncbi:MAG: hypothetical protein NW216_14795 [Hyphomicrobium sp.]|nr:hypothetical protein [Hyphomicrobium sp.]